MIEARVGTSFISIEQARKNLQREIPNWNFEQVTETVRAIQKHKHQGCILHFSTDGRKTVFPPGAEIHIPPVRRLSISAIWKGNTLAVTEGLHFDDNDIPARYLYDLSSDGNQLTMTLFLGEAQPSATFVFYRSSSKNIESQRLYR